MEYQNIIDSLLSDTSDTAVYTADGGNLYYDKKTRCITGADKTVKELDIYKIMGNDVGNVRGIKEMAFIGCSQLKSAVLPKGITSIPNSLFCWCKALENIELPDTLTEIGKNAFAGCGSLSAVEIPKNVDIIKERAFNVCFKMKKLVFKGNLRFICEDAFGSCANLESIEIPEGTIIIGNRAFAGCCGLKSAVLPKSLEYIGQGAFESCTKLTEAKIPENVKKVGTDAFADCDELKTVTFEKEAEIGELFEKGAKTVIISKKDVFVWKKEKRQYIFEHFLKSLEMGINYDKNILEANGKYSKTVSDIFISQIINSPNVRLFMTENNGISPNTALKIVETADNFNIRAEMLEYINKNFTYDEMNELQHSL